MKENKIKVGDIVICVDDRVSFGVRGDIVRGMEYEVLGMRKCVCGSLELNIGVKTINPVCRCSVCMRREETPIAWKRASRFIKKPTEEMKIVTYTHVLEEVPMCAN